MNYIWTKSKKIVLVLMAFLLTLGLVACGPSEDEQNLQELKDALFLGSVSALTDDINLPKTVRRGEVVGSITWTSDNEAIEITTHPTLENNFFLGKVTRPEAGEDDEDVILTATITLNGKSIDREFNATVLAYPESETFTVLEAKRDAIKGQNVELTDVVVVYVMSAGYFVGDETGNMYIYTGGTPTVVIGDVVTIIGEKDIYFDMPQLRNATAVKSGTQTVDLAASAIEAELAVVMANLLTDRSVYGRVYKVEGTVVANGARSNYALENPLTGDILTIYNSSVGLTELLAHRTAGDYVEMLILVHDHHSGGYWRTNYIPGSVQVKEAPQVSDETKVANAISKLVADFTNYNVFGSIALPATDARYEGLTITWTSGTPAVLSDTGEVVEGLENDTNVTMTAEITLNEVVETVEIVFVAKAAEVATIAETLASIEASADTAVWFEGVVLGFDKSGFYVGDETAAIYVRDTAKVANVVVGDEVSIKGVARIFYGSGKNVTDATQFTYQVDASMSFEIAKLDSGVDNPMADPMVKTVEELATTPFDIANATSAAFYGQFIEVTGKLENIQVGSFTNMYLTSGDKKVMINYNSTNEALALLTPLLGEEVTLILLPADLHFSDGWRLTFFGRDGDISFDLSDDDLLDIAEAEIRSIIDTNQIVRTDLEFIDNSSLTAILGNTMYGWNSSHPGVIGHDGKYTAPEADVNVTITVYIFLESNQGMTPNRTLEITVVAKPLPATSGVIINQIYGGGGNSGATYTHDFVELYNTTDQVIELDGWVLQYASATGNFRREIYSDGGQSYVDLTGSIAPGGYYLIQLAPGAAGTTALPTPDAAAVVNASATVGKFALTNTQQVVDWLTDIEDGEIVADFLVDFVGFGTTASAYLGTGPTPAPSNTNAVIRKAGHQNTGDNAADFVVAAPNPRNSQSQ